MPDPVQPAPIKDVYAELARVKQEQQETVKMLVRRDLALGRANDRLRELDRIKSEFISIAAHQLRTPLSAVKWIMSMLEADEFASPEERQEFISKAAESTNRMIALINDLLEVDHLQSGRLQFTFESVDVAKVLEIVTSELKPQIEAKRQTLHMNLAQNAPVKGDTAKLQALLQNLVENAMKYTPVDGTIDIATAVKENFLEISVKDNGIGIPRDQLSQLFTKFFRAKNAMKVDTTGSGLGLFITKQVVERHGGTIRFESVEGKGSTFFVLLPLFKD